MFATGFTIKIYSIIINLTLLIFDKMLVFFHIEVVKVEVV